MTSVAALSTFSIHRVYAYSVMQQRHVAAADFLQPIGGTVKIAPALHELITTAFSKVKSSELTSIDFDISAEREHPVRDDIMIVAFGATNAPRFAAARIAARLSSSMDNRSRAGLLLLTVETDGGVRRRVSLLLLPREEVVQLNGTPSEDVLLELLREAFSTGSSLRKFAKIEGHDSRTQFLSAEVGDFQRQSNSTKDVADFWIKDFLVARSRMNQERGSRLLATALRRVFVPVPRPPSWHG